MANVLPDKLEGESRPALYHKTTTRKKSIQVRLLPLTQQQLLLSYQINERRIKILPKEQTDLESTK